MSRRIAKTVTGPDGRATTTRYGWDGKEQAERAMLAQLGRLLVTHGVALPDEIKPPTPPARVSVFVTDHLGTPLALVDAEGRTEWEARPDDWAAVRDEQGVRQPIRFQGQWHDEESGLYYNRYRYYDPAQGRYITQDPIGLAGGINLYAYVLGPINSLDVNGLAEICSRPLDGFPGIAGPLRHDQIWYDDGTNSGFFPHGIDEDDRPKSDYGSCRRIGRDDDVRAAESRVQQDWKDYNLISNNCQDYAMAVSQDRTLINERIRPVAELPRIQ